MKVAYFRIEVANLVFDVCATNEIGFISLLISKLARSCRLFLVSDASQLIKSVFEGSRVLLNRLSTEAIGVLFVLPFNFIFENLSFLGSKGRDVVLLANLCRITREVDKLPLANC